MLSIFSGELKCCNGISKLFALGEEGWGLLSPKRQKIEKKISYIEAEFSTSKFMLLRFSLSLVFCRFFHHLLSYVYHLQIIESLGAGFFFFNLSCLMIPGFPGSVVWCLTYILGASWSLLFQIFLFSIFSF